MIRSRPSDIPFFGFRSESRCCEPYPLRAIYSPNPSNSRRTIFIVQQSSQFPREIAKEIQVELGDFVGGVGRQAVTVDGRNTIEDVPQWKRV
jgi:hypothetical protein